MQQPGGLLLGRVGRGVASFEQRLVVGGHGHRLVVVGRITLRGLIGDTLRRLIGDALRRQIRAARLGERQLVGEHLVGLGDIHRPRRADASKEVVDVNGRGLGLLRVVALDDDDVFDDHDLDLDRVGVGGLRRLDDRDAADDFGEAADDRPAFLHGGLRLGLGLGLVDHANCFELGGGLDRHHVAFGQLLVEVRLELVVDEREAKVARCGHLGLELLDRRRRLGFDAPRRRVGNLLRRLERALQLARRLLERAPHDVVRRQQPVASALETLELHACGLAFARQVFEDSCPHEQCLVDQLTSFGAPRLDQRIGLCVRIGPNAVGVVLRASSAAASPAFSNSTTAASASAWAVAYADSAAARISRAASSASFVRLPRIVSASLFMRVASSCASRNRRATLSSPLARISAAASRAARSTRTVSSPNVSVS